MSQDQDPVFVKAAFSSIAARYSLTNHILSLGIDVLWRRRVAGLVAAEQPRDVLDVAAGTGDLSLELQRRCPGAEVTASDFCPEMLELARRSGVRKTLEADALNLPFAEGSFDVVTVAYGLRNMSSWAGAVREMRRVLRPRGVLIILDFSLPEGWMRGPYRWYLHRVLPLVAGAMTGNRAAYEYLGDSIERFPSGKAMGELLRANGFAETEWHPLSGGISAIYVSRGSEGDEGATFA
ncbi:MAG: demethylmenaquinone methyltransferase / 2-methoxy-6-polyprenyl-1,4-benzoquinol methylase [Verrucomicrobia bacterium]|jgi:demethylmenaquinone methyltransferase/2-methoxy-6-polyprenyl-1,4-benzoquinol methylase|nr:MAG: demethylmenaquinone methyltransferase / 2-methoxy-6-polyprenyl-1,4-benzoquinol methylase [Verrucomicrobiota bacterium]